MEFQFWSAKVMVGVGFGMLLLTSLQGWGMVGVIAFMGQDSADLLAELKRLHHLGLTGGFLAVSCGLALLVLDVDSSRCTTICRVLLPSFLMAPIAFGDRVLVILAGAISPAFQVVFYALQAASALGITLGLGLIAQSVLCSDRKKF